MKLSRAVIGFVSLTLPLMIPCCCGGGGVAGESVEGVVKFLHRQGHQYTLVCPDGAELYYYGRMDHDVGAYSRARYACKQRFGEDPASGDDGEGEGDAQDDNGVEDHHGVRVNGVRVNGVHI